MTTEEFLALVEKETKDINELLRRKNSDYTGGSTDPFANFKVSEHLGLAQSEMGLLIRMVDKIQRVKSFVLKGKLEVENEGPEDAARDIMGYALVLLGLIKDRKNNQILQATVETNLNAFGVQSPILPKGININNQVGSIEDLHKYDHVLALQKLYKDSKNGE